MPAINIADAFELTVYSYIFQIHWFRNSPPTCLPRNLSPSAASLSRIILYYGYGRNMDHLIAYCANFSSSKPNRVFVIVRVFIVLLIGYKCFISTRFFDIENLFAIRLSRNSCKLFAVS